MNSSSPSDGENEETEHKIKTPNDLTVWLLMRTFDIPSVLSQLHVVGKQIL